MSVEVRLSRNQERAAALALVAVPLLILIALAASLVPAWIEHHARIGALVKERAAERHAVAQAPVMREAIKRLRQSEAATGILFTGGEGAAAKMRAEIGAIVQGDGATIQRDNVELVAAGDDAPLAFRASLSITADIKSLTRVLYHLQQARPLLLVTRLDVRSSASSAPLTAPNKLQTDLVIETYAAAP